MRFEHGYRPEKVRQLRVYLQQELREIYPMEKGIKHKSQSNNRGYWRRAWFWVKRCHLDLSTLPSLPSSPSPSELHLRLWAWGKERRDNGGRIREEKPCIKTRAATVELCNTVDTNSSSPSCDPKLGETYFIYFCQEYDVALASWGF